VTKITQRVRPPGTCAKGRSLRRCISSCSRARRRW
jgi:hypothetical protein